MALEKLSALKVKRVTKPGLYGDGRGLYLRVGDGNAKSWVLRYMLCGLAHSMGLGAVADFSLAEARERAAKYHKLAKQGIDPIEARRAERTGSSARAITLAACAEAHIANHKAAWKGARHANQWTSSLAAYAYPTLGHLPVSWIDTAAVISVLRPIWTQKPETAARLRGRIESVLDFASSAGYRSGENPARWRGHLANLLPRKGKVAQVKHYQALPYGAIPEFMTSLRQRTGIAYCALQFAILTGVRSGEALGAIWDEFDLDAKLWTIPTERMKANRDHIVPLSDAVLAVLEKMRVIRQPGADCVFPGRRRGRPLGHGQMLRTIAALGYRGVTTHGMRSAFRDWAGDCTAFPREIAEAALAHVVGDKSETAYRRSTAIERRRGLMQAWADYRGGVNG